MKTEQAKEKSHAICPRSPSQSLQAALEHQRYTPRYCRLCGKPLRKHTQLIRVNDLMQDDLIVGRPHLNHCHPRHTPIGTPTENGNNVKRWCVTIFQGWHGYAHDRFCSLICCEKIADAVASGQSSFIVSPSTTPTPTLSTFMVRDMVECFHRDVKKRLEKRERAILAEHTNSERNTYED